MARPAHKTFPANLIIEGRPCLVVGGGAVASRKAQLLLEAGGEVIVVSPGLSEALQELAASGAVAWRERGFDAGDAVGMRLAFAATDDRSVNRRVLEACRAERVPCCCVDKQWPESDFLTPATFRREGLTVSVATGGQSCRRSRLVKENLARHVDAVESAGLLIMGTSHQELKIAEREPYHLAGARKGDVAAMLGQVWGVHEFLLLDTCNRVEVWATASSERATTALIRQVLGFDHLAADRFYVRAGRVALEHGAVIAAGLGSQTPGEHHIVAQVKDALAEALAANWAGSGLRACVDAVLHLSREVRRETAPLLRDFEIEDLCLDYLQRRNDAKECEPILVVGGGTVGTGVVERCVERGLACAWCYHQRRPEPPPAWGGRVPLYTFNDLRDRLGRCGGVVCATAHDGYVLHRGHAPFFDQEREVTVVDLAMPRNVEPELGRLCANLAVVDLDDLKHWYRREGVDLKEILDLARRTASARAGAYEQLVADNQGGDAR